MSCRSQPCPLPPTCLEPGSVPVPAAPQAGQCCPQYTCACNASYCPTLVGCPEGTGQILTYEDGACRPSPKCKWTVCSVNGTLYQVRTSRRAFSYTQVEGCGCVDQHCDAHGDLGYSQEPEPPRRRDTEYGH
ncbi:mucin-5AC-like [Molossus nigricans]